MELVVLLIVGVALLAVYYAVTAVATWWDGFGNRHTTLLRAALLIAVVVALLVFVVPESATLGPVIDVAIGAVVALVLVGIVGLAVLVWRRPRRQAVALPAVPQSKRPLVERSSSGRNRQYNASRPPPLVERSSSGSDREDRASRSRRPPAQRRRSGAHRREFDNKYGREIFTYAAGAFDKRTQMMTHVKIGSSARPRGVREAEIEEEGQALRTHEVRELARGPGGERREFRLHRRLDRWRYPASEWFEPSPEVLAAVGELEWLTEDGRRVTGRMPA